MSKELSSTENILKQTKTISQKQLYKEKIKISSIQDYQKLWQSSVKERIILEERSRR